MKTTVDLSDKLLAEAKATAAAEGTTLRSLIEEGLRWALALRREKKRRFTLRDAAVSGRGVRPGLNEGDWGELRDLIYRERGS